MTETSARMREGAGRLCICVLPMMLVAAETGDGASTSYFQVHDDGRVRPQSPYVTPR